MICFFLSDSLSEVLVIQFLGVRKKLLAKKFQTQEAWVSLKAARTSRAQGPL